MPYFRGIEVSIHASLEAKQVTEYPHPDGSSVHLKRATASSVSRSLVPHEDRSSQAHTPSVPDGNALTRLKKVNPRIAVYIPSLPGEQFWLRYLVNQSPPPSKCIFFKMTMNGRHVASWGINTNTHSTGLVVRALYQPEDRWQDPCGSGDNNTGGPGIETRYFHFMPGLDKVSIADDGGVIEVQVFRSKGRKRIAVELDPYRNQERYGITSPSGGLVDNPEDATYYNYYLIDAKDSPYATFCFHYRSMKYLKMLNLVPRMGLDMSPASKSSLDTERERERKRASGKSRPHSDSPLVRRVAFSTTTLESQVFDDSLQDRDGAAHAEANLDKQYFLKSPPEIPPSSLGSTSRTLESGPAGEPQQRPLPEIPTNQPRPASASSLRSNCPSLTPSLRLYVKSDDFENEDIRLSTAQHMFISSESMQALELVDTGLDEGTSFSDYAGSPNSTETSQSPKLPSPRGYIPTTGSCLERHLTQFDSSIAGSSPTPTPTMPSLESDASFDSSQIEPRTVSIELNEGEWLRHSPSPSQANFDRLECHTSPRPGSYTNEEEETSNISSEGYRLSSSTEFDPEEIDQALMGNWI
ncbi:hypothetical protein F4808DRAFT_460193 [Astrocystis sublimbata]|nr:hypothetical protein F4808DRAFT_460193 [Astrocystis sublimbata]